MKWIVYIVAVFSFSSCSFFEEEPEILLSSIDGKEYYESINGEMNARKATLLILEGKKDSVSYELKIDILDSLESKDLLWRGRYLKAFSITLNDIYIKDYTYIEDKGFSLLLHYPDELINHLNNEGFNEIDNWMAILGRAYKSTTEPDDITLNSVANVAISNCLDCDKAKQELIVEFINELNEYEEM